MDSVYLNSSLGFAKQKCASHTTRASDRGDLATLHMTIQPKCKVNENDAQKWIICSYEPSLTASLSET